MKIIEGGVCAAKGFKAGAMRCGIRKSHTKKDLAMILSDWCLQRIGGLYDQPRQGITDFTDKGTSGRRKGTGGYCQFRKCERVRSVCMENARRQAKAGARALGVSEENVIVASTGVIGQDASG